MSGRSRSRHHSELTKQKVCEKSTQETIKKLKISKVVVMFVDNLKVKNSTIK